MNKYEQMKKYEAMSDFEIEQQVTIKTDIDLIKSKSFEWDDNQQVFWPEIGGSVPVLAFCQSPKDAWKIVLDNGISIINIGGTTCWMACSDVNFETICMSPDGNDGGISAFDANYSVHHVNPLRAAMIVFLMLSDKLEPPIK